MADPADAKPDDWDEEQPAFIVVRDVYCGCKYLDASLCDLYYQSSFFLAKTSNLVYFLRPRVCVFVSYVCMHNKILLCIYSNDRFVILAFVFICLCNAIYLASC